MRSQLQRKMYSYQGLSPLTSCQTFQATGVSTVTASEIKARGILSCLQIQKQASLRMKTFKNRRERNSSATYWHYLEHTLSQSKVTRRRRLRGGLRRVSVPCRTESMRGLRATTSTTAFRNCTYSLLSFYRYWRISGCKVETEAW